jgi:hypothetical protein
LQAAPELGYVNKHRRYSFIFSKPNVRFSAQNAHFPYNGLILAMDIAQL